MSSKMIARARTLRKKMTESEKKLWQRLRERRLSGYRFRKQAPMGGYILDFVCHEAKVIIELDGGQHNEANNISYDQKRTKWLSDQG
jgi:very-short-patch-repair endonuclease